MNLNSQIEKLSAAHNEVIKAKEAQIELLTVEIQHFRELTPMKLREYFLSVKEQLEEYNEKLKADLEYRIEALQTLKEKGQLREVTMQDLERDPTLFFEYLGSLSLEDLASLRKTSSDIHESAERIRIQAEEELVVMRTSTLNFLPAKFC